MSEGTKTAVLPGAALNWQANLTHPHLNARLSLQPVWEDVAAKPTQPVKFSMDLTSAHPAIQEILKMLGPMIAQLLPILLASLLASPAPATPPISN